MALPGQQCNCAYNELYWLGRHKTLLRLAGLWRLTTAVCPCSTATCPTRAARARGAQGHAILLHLTLRVCRQERGDRPRRVHAAQLLCAQRGRRERGAPAGAVQAALPAGALATPTGSREAVQQATVHNRSGFCLC